jgi:glycosyltransferase involved in cell wall biosynthesis
MQNEIMVSISCITYNHEDYIADAIESFLMQKTNFGFEILIHDDASTDKTPEIIRGYEKRYPNLIKPIYQTENQYSKGLKIDAINIKRARGKYIALCEGDDYWTDPYKLQKQVDYMAKHPECSVCVHAAIIIDAETKKTMSEVRPSHKDRTFNVEEVIEGGGGLFATNSMIYLAEIGIERPDFYYNAPVGDYPTMIYLALQGTVYYIDEFMSAYRRGVKGSWSNRIASSIDKIINHSKRTIEMLNEVNKYTNYAYDNTICRKIKKSQFKIILEMGNLKEAKSSEFRDLYLELSWKSKIYHNIKYYCPSLAKILFYLNRKICHGH